MLRKIAFVSTVIMFVLIAIGIYLATRQPLSRPAKPALRTVQNAERRLSDALSPTIVAAEAPSSVPPPSPHAPRSATNHSTAPIILTASISQDDLNDVLSGNDSVINELAKQGLTNVQVQFVEPDRVSVTGVVTRGGGRKDITVGGTLSALSPGKVTYTPTDVHLGLLPVPEAPLDSFIRHEGDQLIGKGLTHVPMVIDHLSIKDHRLIMAGRPRGS